MTRADPSTYYTPAPILALCEPQAGSGAFLVNPPWDAPDTVTLPPIGARVLIDCDGGAVPCEVIAHDALRGMVRMRMILPGQKRDGLTFWRPADAPHAAPSVDRVNQPTAREDGDSPMRGGTRSTEGVGWASRPDVLDVVDRSGSRAGVPVAGARPVTGAVA